MEVFQFLASALEFSQPQNISMFFLMTAYHVREHSHHHHPAKNPNQILDFPAIWLHNGSASNQ